MALPDEEISNPIVEVGLVDTFALALLTTIQDLCWVRGCCGDDAPR